MIPAALGQSLTSKSRLFSYERKARPADGLVPAPGAAAGTGEAVPLFKDKAAVTAHRRNEVEMLAGPGGPGQVGQVAQYLFFRQRQQLG